MKIQFYGRKRFMDIIRGKTDCSPEETGYDESRIDKLNERLISMTERRIIHGAAYCICHKGKIIASGAVGRNNMLGENVPMQPDTVFETASLTKVFTATAVMQLVEDGILNLNDAVGKYLPQFAKEPFAGIKLIHLLTHTSGLYPDGGCFDESFPKDHWTLIKEAAKLEGDDDLDWISAGISSGLRRAPGAEWQYCSFGFVLLGEIISRASGTDVHDYIEKNILMPLGLKDSGFYLNKDTAARCFVYSERFREYIEKIVSGEKSGREGNGDFWDKIPQTGGGLGSTVYDLARFGDTFANGGRSGSVRLLGRKSVEKMSKVQLCGVPDHCWGANEPNRLYGIGFDIRRTPSFTYSDRTIMHEGAGASSLDIDLEEHLTAAWFVPFDEGAGGWSAEPLYNVQNIIWSGII